MLPLNAVAQAFRGTQTDYTKYYRVLIDLLDRRDDSVVDLLDSGAIILFEGYEYRATALGQQELYRILQERGY